MALAEDTSLRAATFLLAEGDDLLRGQVAETLLRRGFAVTEAADAPTAMAALRDRPGTIDWLITEITLGDMSGMHVAFEYRFSHPTRSIIVLTGAEAPAEIDRIAGAVVIRKPFGMSILVAAVDALLAHHALSEDKVLPEGRTG